MTALEFSRGWFRKRFGLAIILTPGDTNALISELPNVKAAILQWFQQRRDQAHMVKFMVMSSPDVLDSYESVLRQVCMEEIEIAALLKSRDVQIDFGDRKGKKVLRTVKLVVT